MAYTYHNSNIWKKRWPKRHLHIQLYAPSNPGCIFCVLLRWKFTPHSDKFCFLAPNPASANHAQFSYLWYVPWGVVNSRLPVCHVEWCHLVQHLFTIIGRQWKYQWDIYQPLCQLMAYMTYAGTVTTVLGCSFYIGLAPEGQNQKWLVIFCGKIVQRCNYRRHT